MMSCGIHSFQIAMIQSEKQNVHSKSTIQNHFYVGFYMIGGYEKTQHPQISSTPKAETSPVTSLWFPQSETTQ